MQQDLVGDGWTVLRLDVSRTDTAPHVKALIKSEYNADPANIKAVFLFGHVPVPYSGDIVPDGHIPNHQGAWPADGYYGDMNGTWTDNSVNDTDCGRRAQSQRARRRQVRSIDIPPARGTDGRPRGPGQHARPADVWNGPATFPSELELLRNYLNKDHNFRQPDAGAAARHGGRLLRHARRRSFCRQRLAKFRAVLWRRQHHLAAEQGTWIPTLTTNAYLWAYGCGSGSYTSIGGIGNVGQYSDGITTELVKADTKAVFTLLFGSWLGDWDSEDNIMRAVLAMPSYGLTCGLERPSALVLPSHGPGRAHRLQRAFDAEQRVERALPKSDQQRRRGHSHRVDGRPDFAHAPGCARGQPGGHADFRQRHI